MSIATDIAKQQSTESFITAPHNTRDKTYWDDLTVGQQYSYGSYLMTEQEIITFAKSYDPMEFHTDPEKAKASPLGVLCASGIHTLAIKQRLSFDNVFKYWHIVAGKCLRQCQFIRPVLVNDTLSAQMTILKLDASNHVNRGIVILKVQIMNQKQQAVLEVEGELVLLKRHSA
jgi:acyl dehydratase